jgi:hypothetical protein
VCKSFKIKRDVTPCKTITYPAFTWKYPFITSKVFRIRGGKDTWVNQMITEGQTKQAITEAREALGI